MIFRKKDKVKRIVIVKSDYKKLDIKEKIEVLDETSKWLRKEVNKLTKQELKKLNDLVK